MQMLSYYAFVDICLSNEKKKSGETAPSLLTVQVSLSVGGCEIAWWRSTETHTHKNETHTDHIFTQRHFHLPLMSSEKTYKQRVERRHTLAHAAGSRGKDEDEDNGFNPRFEITLRNLEGTGKRRGQENRISTLQSENSDIQNQFFICSFVTDLIASCDIYFHLCISIFFFCKDWTV